MILITDNLFLQLVLALSGPLLELVRSCPSLPLEGGLPTSRAVCLGHPVSYSSHPKVVVDSQNQ